MTTAGHSWTCEACATRAGITWPAGSYYAKRGYCMLGQHHSGHMVRWLEHVPLVRSAAAPTAAQTVPASPTQGNLFA
jgi:hypothetical protein